ncbi:SusC/RagA family TonB-linked outer membrane protein [Mucilaginibacter terrae]|uniref:SusC/RagA family TonB-linked outer membrane protein n=1 Tax=Mucilaginibacter terrae TaxID=1955052 RepID=UPI00363BAF90
MIRIKNEIKHSVQISFLIILLLFSALITQAQDNVTIKGTIVSNTGEPVIGAIIATKGSNVKKSITDQNGKFTLDVPGNNLIVVVSIVGMVTREVRVSSSAENRIILQDEVRNMNEVIVVGYGQQKKTSVTGAITQTTGKVLERTGGVTNLGMALTGNLPGLVTTASSGLPGGEDPQITIRGVSSWNNSAALVLIDGVERSISSIDISSVATISVLKDASATAIYGVRGANGVILVTTKRGVEGKPQIQIRSNITTKIPSKLPEKYDAYDALMIKNQVIERESLVDQAVWSGYTPMSIINKYRNPANSIERDRYPNVNWEEELFKDKAMSYNTSINISGGSKFVSYFNSVDVVQEGDLFKTFQNNRGYAAGFGYNRTNVRSNLDFNLTKTTTFSTKLFGSKGVRKLPFMLADGDQQFWSSAYRTAPDSFQPVYSDGSYGFFPNATQDQPNAAFWLAYSGVESRTTTQLTTDFILQQQLDMVTKGLSFRSSISLDNSFLERERGIDDRFNTAQRKWISPSTGIEQPEQSTIIAGSQFDFSNNISWQVNPGAVDPRATLRNINYQFSLNYARNFGAHNVTGLALMQRDKIATGSNFPTFRESWAYRVTYNFKNRYLLESNGAYNGSEQFGPDYRFAFFPSLSAGWVVSEEPFMKKLTFIDNFKIRGSWGRIGDDAVQNTGGRFPFRDSYLYGGTTFLGERYTTSPYVNYRVGTLGNPDLRWETSEKRNIAAEYSFLKGQISGNVDFFNDRRTGVVVQGARRAIPSFYGFVNSAPSVNVGEVTSKGYELELKLTHSFNGGTRIWANAAVTHAENKTIFRDDAILTPDYQKLAGFPIGQTTSFVNSGFLTSWDDIYGSTTRNANNQNKLPGDYNIIDYNADGVIDNKDIVPYGYTGTPQNTYNANLGFEWKGLTFFVQFYAVNNVTRQVAFRNFQGRSNLVFVEQPFYFVQNGGGDVPPPRQTVQDPFGGDGTRYSYDGSYIRLKNAEIGYSLPANYVKKVGLKTCRIYVNGNNLLLWTKLPDDRESNFSGSSEGGAYPTVRRINLGLDITL